MNDLAGNDLLNYETIKHEIKARDLQIDNPFTKDPQVAFINNARQFLGDKLVRTAKPHKILSGRNGRLIAKIKLLVVKRSVVFKRISMGKHLIQACNRFRTIRRWRSIWFWWWRCSWISCIRRYFPRWLYLLVWSSAEGIHHHIQ